MKSQARIKSHKNSKKKIQSNFQILLKEKPLVTKLFLDQFAPDHQKLILDCSTKEQYKAGAYLARSGQASHGFYIILSGSIQLNIQKNFQLQTLAPGNVIGWSWILPPHRWAFDIQALTNAEVLYIEATQIRKHMKEDPTFAYEVMKVFFKVMTDRLMHSRLQLLDLYKNPEHR